MMRHNNNNPNHHDHHGTTVPNDSNPHQLSRPVQKVNNFILDDRGDQGDLIDYGDDQFNSSSDDEYIDDYYAAATTYNQNQNLRHRQQQTVREVTTELEVIREQPNSTTSAQPSTISSSENDLVSGYANASVNIAMVGQTPQAVQYNHQQPSNSISSSQIEASVTPQKQYTSSHLHQSNSNAAPVQQQSSFDSFSFDREDPTIRQQHQQQPSSLSSDAIGSGLLSPTTPGNAAAVPSFFDQKTMGREIISSPPEELQQTPVLNGGGINSQQINQLQFQQQQQLYSSMQNLPLSSTTKAKVPRRKRKINDDYGIYYNYTCESDSSQTTPGQSSQPPSTEILNQQVAYEVNKGVDQPMSSQSTQQDLTPSGSQQALQAAGFNSLSALRNAAAQARSSAHLQTMHEQLRQIGNQNKVSEAPAEIRKQASNNAQVLSSVVLSSNEEMGVSQSATIVHSPSHDNHRKDASALMNSNLPQRNQHSRGRNDQQRLSPQKILGCNQILAPQATISSGRKFNEEKSFRHDFYSMDPAEANEQLGANPISLGMDGDLGMTLTQTGFEGLFENELVMELVMSRVDWIIQLRDIFYSLLDSTQNRQNGKIRADKLMKHLVSLQDTLKLIPRDEYVLSNQRHEVCINYGTVLQNLRKRTFEHQMNHSMQIQALGHSVTKDRNSINESLDTQGNNVVLFLQLDDVIDLPFVKNNGSTNISQLKTSGIVYPNTSQRRNEDRNAFVQQDRRTVQELLNHTQTNLNLKGVGSSHQQMSPNLLSENRSSLRNPTPVDKYNQRTGAGETSLQNQINDVVLTQVSKTGLVSPDLIIGPTTKRTSTPQIHIVHEKLLKTQQPPQQVQQQSRPGTKLSSIESRPSSSEPEMIPNSLDESRQQVYGTKSRRGSKAVRSHSQKKNRNKTKSQSPHRNNQQQQITSQQKYNQQQPFKYQAKQSMSPFSSNRDNEVFNAPLSQLKSHNHIRGSVSSSNFERRTSSQHAKPKTKDKKIHVKKSRRLSQMVVVDKQSDQRGAKTYISNSNNTVSDYQQQQQSTIGAGDSQVQLLSIDAYKYATQSPPLTMITKTLPYTRQQNNEHPTNEIEADLTRIHDFAAQPQNAILLSNRSYELNGQIASNDGENDLDGNDLERTRHVITPTGLLNKARVAANNKDQSYGGGQHNMKRTPIELHTFGDQMIMSDNEHSLVKKEGQSLSPKKKATRLQVLQLLTPEKAKSHMGGNGVTQFENAQSDASNTIFRGGRFAKQGSCSDTKESHQITKLVDKHHSVTDSGAEIKMKQNSSQKRLQQSKQPAQKGAVGSRKSTKKRHQKSSKPVQILNQVERLSVESNEIMVLPRKSVQPMLTTSHKKGARFFEQSPIINNCASFAGQGTQQRQKVYSKELQSYDLAASKQTNQLKSSHVESELQFPAPISFFQQQQLLMAVKKRQELDYNMNEKAFTGVQNNMIHQNGDFELTEEPIVAQEESKTSVLLFDHVNMLTSSPDRHDRQEFHSTSQPQQQLHSEQFTQNLTTTQQREALQTKAALDYSPSQTWKKYFQDSETQAKEQLQQSHLPKQSSSNHSMHNKIVSCRMNVNNHITSTNSNTNTNNLRADAALRSSYRNSVTGTAGITTNQSMPPKASTSITTAFNQLATRAQKVVPVENFKLAHYKQDESASNKEFFDIELFGKELRETLMINDLELRKGIKSHLRSMNLGQNLLRNFYELSQTEARQLLILNLSMNQISSLAEVALCPNLQFLNLAYNLLRDPNEVNRLRKLTNLQELYLSHNKVDFKFNKDLSQIGGAPSRRNYQPIWPYLEILDLTANRCTDFSQVEFLFSGQFVQGSVIRVIGVADNFTNDESINACIQDEKCPMQLNFSLNYIDILDQYSKFIGLNDTKITQACVGIRNISGLPDEISSHQSKISSAIEDKNHLTLALQSTEKANSRKVPTNLHWLLRGSFTEKNSNQLYQGQQLSQKSPDDTYLQIQQHPQKSNQTDTNKNCDSNLARGLHKKSINNAQNNAVTGKNVGNNGSCNKAQTNITKVPLSSSQQTAQQKKRLLRILSPTAMTNNNGTKNVNPHQNQVVSMFANEHQQPMTTTAKNAQSASSKPIRVKRLSQKVTSNKHQSHMKKHGIKQIQMVYLNPSHGGSRRSSSIRSNNSGSRNSELYNNNTRNAPHALESSDGQQELSIQQAYKQEGRQSKQKISSLNNRSGSGSTKGKRNKSISSRQTDKRSRILSPSNFVAPRFDSYETLPKRNEQLLKSQQNPLNNARQAAVEVTPGFNKTQTLSRQGMNKLATHQPQNRAANQGSFVFKGSLAQGNTGVSQGLNTQYPNALKLNLPKQFSPTKLQNRLDQQPQLANTTARSKRDSSRKKSVTPMLSKGQTQSAQTIMRVRFKNSKAQNQFESSNRGLITQSDSFACPQNNSSESGKTTSVQTGKTSKLRLAAAKCKSSKQASHQLSRVPSHEGSFIISGGSSRPALDSKKLTMIETTYSNNELPVHSNVYNLSVKNIRGTQASKTVLHQASVNPSGSQSTAKPSSTRKTPMRGGYTSSSSQKDEHSQSRGKSSSLLKSSKNANNIYSQTNAYLSSNQSMKQMTLSQNTSSLLQKLSLKGKQTTAGQNNNGINSDKNSIKTSQSRKLKIMASLSSAKHYRKAGGDLRQANTEIVNSPIDLNQANTQNQRQTQISASMKQFRLFTTKSDNFIDDDNQDTIPIRVIEDDQPCEAIVATENLPNEPLMPRSHKSSARSFLKNIGHVTQTSQENKISRSFLQNVSSTSKHTNSTAGMNTSQPLQGKNVKISH